MVTPHVEAGRIFDLGGENRLRGYVDAGVRLAPLDLGDLRHAGRAHVGELGYQLDRRALDLLEHDETLVVGRYHAPGDEPLAVDLLQPAE